jgi:hypothetical protein
MLGEWILNDWGRISSEAIIAGFKKCCISGTPDGTEDDFPWQDVEKRMIVKKEKRKKIIVTICYKKML